MVKKSKSQKKLERAMREVHKHHPKTATKKGGEAQLRAIAFSKARKRGARLRKKK